MDFIARLVPDTVSYFIAGYVVFTVVIGAYLVSLALRWRKARRELESLQDR